MPWTVEVGRKLRGKPAVFTKVFGLRTPQIATAVVGEPFATTLAKRGCDEYLLRDARGVRARVWLSPDGERGVVHEPEAKAPVKRVGRSIQGGPMTLAWLNDGAIRVLGKQKLPPELTAAVKAASRLAKKGGAAPVAAEKLRARWARRVPKDLGKLTALERAQLSAASRGLGHATLPKLLAWLEKEDVDVEEVVLTGTTSLVGWALAREDAVFFDAEGKRPNGIAMSQGSVHDETKRRDALVAGVQKAMDAIAR